MCTQSSHGWRSHSSCRDVTQTFRDKGGQGGDIIWNNSYRYVTYCSYHALTLTSTYCRLQLTTKLTLKNKNNNRKYQHHCQSATKQRAKYVDLAIWTIFCRTTGQKVEGQKILLAPLAAFPPIFKNGVAIVYTMPVVVDSDLSTTWIILTYRLSSWLVNLT